jgi:hypothetical protein
MKKLKLILVYFLLAIGCEAQINSTWYRIVKTSGVPAFTPSTVTWKTSYVAYDTLSGNWYEYNAQTKKWSETMMFKGAQPPSQAVMMRVSNGFIQYSTNGSDWINLIALSDLKGDKGDKGDTGLPGQAATVTIGTTTTLPAGSNATVTNSGTSTNAILNFGIPRGADGTSGGQAATQYIAYPENYGAVNANRTFAQAGLSQAYIDANYPGLGFTTSDQIDAAALSKAMNTGMPVFITKTLYINKLTPIKKTQFNVWVQGFNDTINVVGSPASLFSREQPSSIAEAEFMCNARFHFIGLIINCNNQTTKVFDVGSTYQAVYSSCRVFGGYSAYHLTFSMDNVIEHCDATGSLYGIVLDYYRYSWATRASSACNNTTVRNFRFYSTNPNAVGIVSYATNGLKIDQIIGEGSTYKHLISIEQAGLTTSKLIDISGVHYESATTAPPAVINLDMDGGYVRISGVVDSGQPAIMVKAKSVGVLVVEVQNIGWWKLLNGKMFDNTDCGWVISGLPFGTVNPSDVANSVRNLFQGKAVSIIGSSDVVQGYNRVKVLY